MNKLAQLRPSPPGTGCGTAPRCDVCRGVPVAAVACCTLGGVSFGYCRPCLEAGAEPWGMVVHAVALAGADLATNRFLRETAQATCTRLGRTMEQLTQAAEAVVQSWEGGDPDGSC